MNAPIPLSLEFPFAAPPAPGTSLEVAPGVHWIRMPLPFALDHVNVWRVGGREGDALVDCGIGDGATRALWSSLLAARPAPVSTLVATHYHPDHLGNAAWLGARFGLAPAMTLGEFLQARSVWNDEGPHSLSATTRFLRAHGMDDAHAEALAARGNAYRRGVPELPESFHRLVDGDSLVLGDGRAKVIAGYGHSPEHAALHLAGTGVLLSGDMLLPRISTNVGAWPGEPDGDPLQRFLDSIGRFESLPARTLVLPAHGLPFRGIGLRVAALRAHHAARLAELEDFTRGARAPVSAADVLPTLFRRELDLQQRFFAMGEAIAHLNHLWHRGRLARLEGESGAVRYQARP